MCCAVINLTFLLYCCHFAMRLTWKLFLLTVWIGRSIVGWLSSLRISIWIHLLHSLLIQLWLSTAVNFPYYPSSSNINNCWKKIGINNYRFIHDFIVGVDSSCRCTSSKISNFKSERRKVFWMKRKLFGLVRHLCAHVKTFQRKLAIQKNFYFSATQTGGRCVNMRAYCCGKIM